MSVPKEESQAKRSRLAGAGGAPLRVGGVPEHFNYPWSTLDAADVEWVEMKCGTGQMIEALKAGEVDLIVALTEGLVADIAQGSDLRLLGTYVSSPLCWAISAAGADSPHAGLVQSVEDLRGKTFGISRFTSGSHLMAYVLASERGWDPQKDISFAVKGNFQQLRDGVNDGSTAAFMWETFTTKPFHDSGEVRRIGDISTPWPCFMLAARQSVVSERLADFQRTLAAIHAAAQEFHAAAATMPGLIAKRYQLKPEDAKAWYEGVHISAERFISEAALERVVTTLRDTGVIAAEADVDINALIDPRLAEIRRDIHSMKLYSHPQLITALHRRLAAAGLAKGEVRYTDLLPYDQHHYHGTQAVDDAAERLAIGDSSRVINIGSGLGGPARYLAGSRGCQVLACELQEDLHRTASELTARCALSSRVHHLGGDFLQLAQHLQHSAYDCIVSWLTVLHIADRVQLFKRCYNLLRPGGVFFAADFFALGNLTKSEWKILHEEVACPSLAPSISAYQSELELAGFKIISMDDVTADWTAYTAGRVQQMKDDRAKLVGVLGEEIYESLLFFYSRIAELYAGGRLGGVHVYAQKPLGW